MALTPAERQRIRREKLKKQGTTRRDWVLEPEELRMLGEICTQRRPGREPYSENEVIGLLIRKNYKELQKKLSGSCTRCGQELPVSECLFDGEGTCHLTTLRLKLAIKA
ncbi:MULTISPECIES: hypothetical protein [Enterobacteriaceae]|jgi:hypothetical protein|uniref:hypothetical protein n=1 Tax=Enterobacteriaceae TaxID=543 RepID=UPI000BB7F4A5|nr:hypothetical protein [Enterobacter hormaechei]MCU2759990.1 hypothetical protein [Enterobacter hormaechei subsp. steigerwaltii]MKW15598.1 hypothetical protein [Salmonella enterica subsp. enterica]CAE7138276.1 hypothetical protein AI2688V1_5134 [Enterobacter cloacae]HDT3487239.1 hypothetical protein [Enterobacter hormaechei subsp. hoffmannii]ELD4120870.1 hypothetical protein [Enterobacter hormaechei]